MEIFGVVQLLLLLSVIWVSVYFFMGITESADRHLKITFSYYNNILFFIMFLNTFFIFIFVGGFIYNTSIIDFTYIIDMFMLIIFAIHSFFAFILGIQFRDKGMIYYGFYVKWGEVIGYTASVEKRYICIKTKRMNYEFPNIEDWVIESILDVLENKVSNDK